MRDGMYLSPVGVWAIGIIYGILIVVFSLGSYHMLDAIASGEQANLGQSILISTDVSLCVTPLFYLRKLYKDIFAGLSKNSSSELNMYKSATFIYFVSRPIFSVVISAIVTLTFYAAVRQFSVGHVGVNTEFAFFSAISSAIISIGAGAAVTRVEEMAKAGHSFMRPPM